MATSADEQPPQQGTPRPNNEERRRLVAERNRLAHERQKAEARRRKMLSQLVSMTAAITAATALTFGTWSLRERDRTTESVIFGVQLSADLGKLKSEIELLRLRLDKLEKMDGETPELGKVVNAVEGIQSRVQGLEAALLETPAKSLAVPLLKQDLESAKQQSLRDAAANQQQIDRIYAQMQWTMGGIGLPVIALAVSVFLSNRKPSSPREKEEAG